MQYILVYITTADQAEAETIAKNLIKKGLAACANIVYPMQSLYWWKEALQKDTEAVLLLKTEFGRFEALKREVARMHSYETPCIVALPIIDGSRDYLDWISRSCNQNSEQE